MTKGVRLLQKCPGEMAVSFIGEKVRKVNVWRFWRLEMPCCGTGQLVLAERHGQPCAAERLDQAETFLSKS